jgi:2-polyprenyl-6-methoxyphenol hydroxylase-like FAD-dependent oxidoreductase
MTVVERMPLARVRTSGHAVDLFGRRWTWSNGPACFPRCWMPPRTEIVSFSAPTAAASTSKCAHVVAGISGRHVEVMRGELATTRYEATRSDAQYLFEDSIHTINGEPDGIAVTFEHAPADRFDLVIGADGLHSIDRLVLGPKTSSADFSVSVMAYTVDLP